MRGGTTCALTMETVNHTEVVFEAAAAAGFRATIGKCMMDFGDDVPAALHEDTDVSLGESLRLLEHWHGRADGRLPPLNGTDAPKYSSCRLGLGVARRLRFRATADSRSGNQRRGRRRPISADGPHRRRSHAAAERGRRSALRLAKDQQ